MRIGHQFSGNSAGQLYGSRVHCRSRDCPSGTRDLHPFHEKNLHFGGSTVRGKED